LINVSEKCIIWYEIVWIKLKPD